MPDGGLDNAVLLGRSSNWWQYDPTCSSSSRASSKGSKEQRKSFTKAAQVLKKDEKRSMFVDAEEMKARVRSNLRKPTYTAADFYHKSGLFRAIATNNMFESITLVVIAFNALWIAIDTDNNGADSLMNAKPVFQIVEHSFCFYFSFELFIRFMAFKRKRDGLKDAWFVFDSALVLMMVVETWAFTIVLLILGGGSSSGLGNASILRLLRLLRLSKMARLLILMPEVLILIKGMVAAFRSVFFTMCLLLALIYIFAIALRQLTNDTVAGSMYFASVSAAMYTLLMNGTFLEDLKVTVDRLSRSDMGHPVYACVFLIFVCFSALMVMNMLIGVLCEVVSAVASTEKEEITVKFVKAKMQELMEEMDSNFNNVIDRAEFERILENPSAVMILNDIGVDPIALVDLADHIFEDKDKSNIFNLDDEDAESVESEGRSLDFGAFMEIILELRGSNGATVKDIQNLSKTIKVEIKRMEERQRSRARSKVGARSLSSQKGLRDTQKLAPTVSNQLGELMIASASLNEDVPSPSVTCESSVSINNMRSIESGDSILRLESDVWMPKEMNFLSPGNWVAPSVQTATIPTITVACDSASYTGNSDEQQIRHSAEKVEGWLTAAQSELRRLRCSGLPGLVDSSQSSGLQALAANLDDAVTKCLADLQQMQILHTTPGGHHSNM